MNNYHILKHKNWTCEFSSTNFSLNYSGQALIESYSGYEELIAALSSYLCKKTHCKYPNQNFRIENDENEQSVLITKKETQGFLNFLQNISLEIGKIRNYDLKISIRHFQQSRKGPLSNFSMN
ncbi:MAG: hypothetical protein CMP61_05895 [Flavobacteriales bacterium]|nr:hypothetical protein [Flavobacteriales bacterium]|tara:strand:+ start:5147 stop:5515 length:369 start_codon:yes stop_codon:yes gene_type:complete